MGRKPLWIVPAVLALPWILSAIGFRSLHLYGDSIFTVGAGVRMACMGHNCRTFMLYGLINPGLLEGLIRAGIGTAAPHILRLIQAAAAFLGMYGLALALRRLRPGTGRNVFPLVLIPFLASPVFLVESFELTPEIMMFTGLSWLLLFSLEFDGSLKGTLKLAAVMAALAGARPTAVLLWAPAFLTACGFHRGSALEKVWRWVFLGTTVIMLLSISFISSETSETILGLVPVTLIVLTGTALPAFLTDLKNRRAQGWRTALLLPVSAVLFTLLLFPSYLINLPWLLQQVELFHIQREVPAGAVQVIAENAALGGANLAVLFPGLPGSIGLFTAIGMLVRKRGFARQSPAARLLPFMGGLLPFFISAVRYENLQSRYLVPLMPLVFLASAEGIRFLMGRRITALAMVPPMLFALFSLGETLHHRTRGGILNAFDRLESAQARTWTCAEIFPASPGYYSPPPPETISPGPYICTPPTKHSCPLRPVGRRRCWYVSALLRRATSPWKSGGSRTAIPMPGSEDRPIRAGPICAARWADPGPGVHGARPPSAAPVK